MLEMLLCSNRTNIATGEVIFLGEVSTSAFITGDALASAIGLTQGNSQYSNEPWLKFNDGGIIKYIAKKAFRGNVQWQSIYQAGAVYGDGTNGKYPSGTPRIQNAQVLINGNLYKVRLIQSSLTNPIDLPSTSQTKNPSQTIGSEWDRIMYGIVDGTLANYSNNDLLINNTTGQTWCIESNIQNNSYRSLRGISSVYDLYFRSDVEISSFRGWRPLLELVS